MTGRLLSLWSGPKVPTAHDGITVVATRVFPLSRLIDLHNHMHYNHIPLWDFEVTSPRSRSRERGYTNRYQWGNNWDYGPSITWMKTNIQSSSRWECQKSR
ncbi:MAG: hypothetical protein Ct9H90mP16_18610 [Candidatus Poseidoniales archaeon]|nr:MAG: hypothetical protein Ct9H90mP16_18610 [Candidatus Poseidoniales archaeon]